MIPGEYFIEEGSITLNAGRETRSLRVEVTDRSRSAPTIISTKPMRR